MEKIGLIIDSTVYLDKKTIKEHDIKVVSLNVIDGEKSYKETEITSDFAYKRQDENARLTTSQPAPQEFLDTYNKAFKEGNDKIIVLTLSKGLSGTYQSAVLARNMSDKTEDIHILDTSNAAYGNELIMLELIKRKDNYDNTKDLVAAMQEVIDNSGLFFTVENLHSLQKGGRLSKAQAMIGTVLRIKPIIRLTDGKLSLWHKERTHKKVIDKMVETIKEDGKDRKNLVFRIIDKNSVENATALKDALIEVYPEAEYTWQDYLGPVFAIHVGKKGFGIAWYFSDK